MNITCVYIVCICYYMSIWFTLQTLTKMMNSILRNLLHLPTTVWNNSSQYVHRYLFLFVFILIYILNIVTSIQTDIRGVMLTESHIVNVYNIVWKSTQNTTHVIIIENQALQPLKLTNQQTKYPANHRSIQNVQTAST